MTLTATTPSDQDARRRRTVVWVVALATFGLIFDGYDLVVYGAVVSTFLKDPSQLGEVTPAMAGTLGSYALLGMMFGALLAGAFGDILGRRKVMLIAYGWFSVGMFITALMSTTTTFGVMRFLTGLGIGALIATTATLVTEIAPPGKKNLCSAITYSGVPLGSLLGALLAILFLGAIGWRGLFMIGALPIFTLLPLALLKMPESVPWLVARGQIDKARAVSERTGVPMPESVPESQKAEKVGIAGLFSRRFILSTVVVGLMGALAQFLNYYLNTWLPVLMEQAGFNTKGSLAFLLVLSGGAIIGALAGSRFADLFGPKPVVAVCFLIGAVFIGIAHSGPAFSGALTFRRRRRIRYHRNVDPDLWPGGQPLPHQDAGRCRSLGCGLRPPGRCQRSAARRPVPGRRSRGEFGLLCAGRPGPRGCRPDVAGPKSRPHERHSVHPGRSGSAARRRDSGTFPDCVAA